MKVKIINKSHHPLPSYGTFEAAGMDVRAYLPEGPVTLRPMQRALIPTGLYMQLPSGYECQIRPRSGLALKRGLTILNTPGTIDADYRGEIGIILINLGDSDFVVNDGERICQMVIKQYTKWNGKRLSASTAPNVKMAASVTPVQIKAPSQILKK